MTDDERRQRIDELCDAALNYQEGERAAFVAVACGDDDALRHEVESLLTHAAQADGFLIAPVAALAAEIMAADPLDSLVGRQIGSHKILSLLGAGGMGDVYRAHDTKLGREVALKVISGRFASAPDRLGRFELEARVLATLNHRHIGAIYGLEEAEGIRALVLELVEGPTLAERLASGPLPMPDALAIARQIADALEAAHDKGIIHRDLKPANIKLTADGTVKVLDFGLAKVFARDDAVVGDAAQSLSMPVEPSREGEIAGTTAYMSPEQARGRAVAKRTDIWAFGCVLYEMVTGRAAFHGDTASDTIAAVLEHEPDWSAPAIHAQPAVLRLLQRCLEKDQRRRLRDIGDARIELEDALTALAPVPGAAGIPRGSADRVRLRPLATGRRRAWWAAMAAALGVVAAAAIWQLRRLEYFWRDPLQGATVTRLTDFDGAEHHAAISRDGKLVVFLSNHTGPWDAWVHQVGTHDFQNLTNGSVPELRNPATRALGFNPDGTLVTIWQRVPDRAKGGQVNAGWAVPTLGGPLRPYLNDIPTVSELDWAADGRMVFHPPAEGDPLFVLGPDGKGGLRKLYEAQKGFHNHFPLWSRDGAFVYFVHGLPLEKNDLWRIGANGGEPERLTFHESRVSFPTFVNDQTLLYLATDDEGYGPWVHAMDIARRIPHRLFTGVDPITSLAASADGRRIVAAVSHPTTKLWRVPIAAGERVTDESAVTQLTLPTANGLSPRVQSRFILYRGQRSGKEGLWRLEPGGGGTELWSGIEGRAVAGPAVAANGRIAFVAQKQGRNQLYVINADGTGARHVAPELDVRGAPAWSPDGQWLAIAAATGDGVPQVFKIPVSGGTPVLLVKEYSTDPVWAPDGRFLVFSGADVGTTFSVKAVSADGAPHALPELTLTRGARRVVFLDNGTLVIMKGNVSHKDFWSVDLATGGERQLTSLGRGLIIGDFDISPDGRDILFDRTREESDIVLFAR